MDPLTHIIATTLFCVFFFFVYNTSPIGEPLRNFVNKTINRFSGRSDSIGWFFQKLSYLTKCCFCVSFWLTILGSCFRITEYYVVFCAPVLAPIVYKALIVSMLPIQFSKPKENKIEARTP